MRKSLATALAMVTVCCFAGIASGGASRPAGLEKLTSKFPFAILVGSEKDKDLKFLYADVQSHVHVFRVSGDRLEPDWENTNLGSRVKSLFVADLYGDGSWKLIIATAGGRILIYEMDGYDLEWENLQDPFDHIEYMVSENLDDDPQHELVFIADQILYIYDSLKKTIEWQSQDNYTASHMILGNVDDDEQLEIIMNTGVIIDSRLHNVEFQTESGFGNRIFLLDINGDDVPEIVGEHLDFNLKFFDVYAEREIW